MKPTFLAAALASATLAAASARANLPGEGYKNHLVFSIGVGFDTLHPTEWDAYTDAFNQANGGQAGQNHPSIAIHVPLEVTYYAPYYILVRSGAEALYFFPSTKVGGDTVTNYGGTLEVPLLLGGHYALVGNRLIVEIAAGPCIAAFTSAGLNGNDGNQGYQQVYATPSFGFDSELKGQFFLSPGFSLGLEVGYRILSSNEMHVSGASTPYEPYRTPIHLDLSGFRTVFVLGFAAL